jgi:PAS domain S-box-containing protein
VIGSGGRRSKSRTFLEALAVLTGFVLVLAVAIAGASAYRYQKKMILSRTVDILKIHASSQKNWLNNRMIGCMGDFQGLSSEPAISALNSDPHAWARLGEKEKEAIRVTLRAYAERNDFAAAALFDESGKLLPGSEAGDLGTFCKARKVPLPGDSRRVWEASFQTCGGVEHLQVGVPLATPTGKGPTWGAVFFLNPWGTFYASLFQSCSDLKTAETLLYQREGQWVVSVAPTRLLPSRPCSLKEPFNARKMASLAVSGEITQGEDRDYRGVDVLYASQYVPRVEWGLIIKVDQKEAFAPLRITLFLVILIIALSAGAMAYLAWVWWRKSHEAVLHELKSIGLQYRSLVESAQEGIWVWDAEGHAVLSNPRLAEMLGMEQDRLKATPFRDLLGPGQEELARSYHLPKPTSGGEEHEVRLRTRHGEDLWGILSLSSLHSPEGEFRGTLGMLTDITQRRRVESEKTDLLKDLESKKAQLQHLLHQLFSTQERERRHLSHELHDDVVQHLMAADGYLQGLQNQVGPSSQAGTGAMLSSAREILGKAGDRCRKLIVELRPPDLERLGCVAVLEQFLAGMGEVNTHLTLTGEDRLSLLGYDGQSVLCKVVQEALLNVRKHARAKEVRLRIEGAPGEVRVDIEDDGQGFDSSAPGHPGHYGLLVMRERMEHAGGSLHLESHPGEGTKVVLTLPMTPPPSGLRLVEDAQAREG